MREGYPVKLTRSRVVLPGGVAPPGLNVVLQFACLAVLVVASADKTAATFDLGRCLDIGSERLSSYIVTDGEHLRPARPA